MIYLETKVNSWHMFSHDNNITGKTNIEHLILTDLLPNQYYIKAQTKTQTLNVVFISLNKNWHENMVIDFNEISV